MSGMLPAVSLISAAVLAYEVLLMRLLAIVQWHHFAYMVISIALLGYGASGTFLTLSQRWLKPRFAAVFSANAALFGLSAVSSFVLGERVPFNALEVVWNPHQLLYLAVLYLIFIVPFFCGANCVGLAFTQFGNRIGRIYRYDLVGAGIGAIGVVALLSVLSPVDCLRFIMGLGLMAAGFVYLASSERSGRWIAVAWISTAVVLPVSLPHSWITLRISEYKGLSMALQLPQAAVIAQHSSPLGLLTLVESPTIPFRHVPGLSLNSTTEPPVQLGIFTDGDAPSVITRYDGRRESLAYLDFVTSALPYHLTKTPSVLVLGAGGGTDVLQSLYHGARQIDAVELNPQMVHLVQQDHRDFAGRIFGMPEVQVHVAEARSFVTRSPRRWNIIQIPLLDSAAASAAGVQSLSESYLYTVEAVQLYIRRLEPGGLLAITRWLKLPPRDSLKLLITGAQALEREGLEEPERRLALIRSWSTTTLVVKNGKFSETDIDRMRAFATQRSFDLAYYPGMTAAEANRFNILTSPYFFEAAGELLSERRAAFIERYKFDLTPASDDQPYFFDFFRWRSLPEFLQLRSSGGASLLEWGYLILFATLIQAAVLSFLFILLPLWVRRTKTMRDPQRARILAYFGFLGLAFLFIEIAFIQRFIVFVGHPLYAVAVVLCGFLLFAGLGAGYAPRFDKYLENSPSILSRIPVRVSAIDVSVAAIGAVALVYLVLLPLVFSLLIAWPAAAKGAASLVLLAPLAFFMGMPFPLGLSRVSGAVPELVPWSWGVNGCASVLSAVLAMVLAIHFGFTVVVTLAVCLYLGAAATFRRPLSGANPGPS